MRFPFFNSRFSILNSNVLSGSTDIHCHILPGVDDGIKDYVKAVSALRWLYVTGIRRLYLTPHVMSDFPNNSTASLTEKFAQFIKQLENEGITDIPALKLAAEYMLEASFHSRKEKTLLMYANRHLLVETSYLTPPIGLKTLLDGLIDSGYTPILAHPERYTYMDRMDYETLKKQKIKFQLNYLSLIGVYGAIAEEKASFILKERLYDFTGSDLHHLNWHRNNIRLKKLTKKQISQLQLLFQNNAQLW